uniref:Uncharacterized protein n=1 Tax=Rhizophora mucronata TaxID=61149 RepID=A0A2P2Q7B0_RHIMU
MPWILREGMTPQFPVTFY